MRRASIQAAAVVTAIVLGFSAMASADPLTPGKPAGVHAAQMMGDKEWLVFGGVAVVLTAVLVANVGSGDHTAVAAAPITIVSPTTS